MSSRPEESGEWRRKLSTKGTACSLSSQTDYTGREIFFDLTKASSTVSPYFVAKWRSVNDKLQGVFNHGVLLTTLSLGGRHYPLFASITQDFSPLILGTDFFQAFDWQFSEEGFITTSQGKIQTLQHPGGLHQINTQMVEDVLKCNEVLSQTRPRGVKLAKLHKYFAHASAESLWRLIKNSSNPDSYTQVEVATICESCPTCQVHKRKMPKKKTSLPRSTAFNQVVCIDLKCHSDGSYVLWLVDDATRLIAGHVIHSKQPKAIIAALDTAWITGHGKGPGLPEKYFLADNGREFVN